MHAYKSSLLFNHYRRQILNRNVITDCINSYQINDKTLKQIHTSPPSIVSVYLNHLVLARLTESKYSVVECKYLSAGDRDILKMAMDRILKDLKEPMDKSFISRNG
ncbi:hypothetical protein BgiBS90_007555 [Biomphalaria glabrata]|nr:hypothetical protein BgiBS90_007555 [Biomphalaria glabrata]